MDNIKDYKVSTGSLDLDKLLGGGYESGIITMLVGPPGTGKTNLCILASCSQALKGKKIIFVDTEGGFSIERVKQLTGEKYKDVLSKIFLLEPTSFDEQKTYLSKLSSSIKKDQVNLIIIDGMAMLYRLKLSEASESKSEEKIREVNSDMAWQMSLLAKISRKYKIPIIITNQVYFGFLTEKEFREGKQRKTNIVGGDLLKYWSKCIIELKKGRTRRLKLLKHRSLPEREMSFEIKNSGVFKKGWI